MNIKNSKCLVAYFSRPGNNYVGGTIVNLPVGNTEVVARMIQELTGGDLFRIEAVHAYPGDYTETTEVAKEELQTNARPKLSGHLGTVEPYDILYLGYPIWWGTMPMPVFTFFDDYDFTGKKIAPFCTHEGSGLGRSVTDIKKMCPQSTVLEALAIRGGEVRNAKDAVARWLQEIAMKRDQ